MKIWNQNSKDKNSAIDYFLSGEDIVLDQELFLYDIEASIAHAHELQNINILTKAEAKKIVASLTNLAKLFQAKKFKLTTKYEDCHSAIEDYLTKELGSVGKKIHTGRSRNDQVMVAMRLYARSKLDDIQLLNLQIAKSFFDQAENHSSDPMPGYTHLQRAMPSTWGLWFGAFAESFLDNIDLISNIQSWMNINPLGSAAGYGVNLPIQRDISTKELSFKRKQLNSLYVQNSRGKFELELVGSLKQPMLDVRKFSWDMSIFLAQEFSLLSVASKYSTGSSIMPNKSNPDVIELMRANYAVLAGHYSELENLISLPSGYHRDLQLTKRSLIHSIHCVSKTLALLPDLIASIKVDLQRSSEFIDQDMMMTDQAYALVQSGLPFREAYLKVKSNKDANFISKKLSRKNSSSGSAYNLDLKILRARLRKLTQLK
ncbi:argininosuccinate lyase [Gammaproteobacteria bacterium]|nr:argininosuccinate lyase [Gammaproteobacteria bacterium]